jgi:phosphate transport system substrate-binding protein
VFARNIHGYLATTALVAALGLVTASCGGSNPADGVRDTAAPGQPVGTSGAAARLSGNVTVDGSSTLLPVSKVMADRFQAANQDVHISVQESGTGGGFKKLCSGELDIADASRPINNAESQQCLAKRIEYMELPVAFDALSVVVNASNDFASCLTVDELRKMWAPAAAGQVSRWNQIRSSFPDKPLALFGPGTASGTFDYFTLAVVGTQSSSRMDYSKSEDDAVLVKGVADDPNALGYFGYGYYLANKDKLKLVSIDGGKGCVVPSAETVVDGTYQPLSRPVFIYINKTAAARPEVNAFARFYIAPESSGFVHDVGYLPLPPVTLLSVAKRLDRNVTGSIFGGRGSVIGVTAETFQDDDRSRARWCDERMHSVTAACSIPRPRPPICRPAVVPTSLVRIRTSGSCPG